MIRLVVSKLEDVERCEATGQLQLALHRYQEAAEWSRIVMRSPALLDEIKYGGTGPLSQEFGEALKVRRYCLQPIFDGLTGEKMGRRLVGRMNEARERLNEHGYVGN